MPVDAVGNFERPNRPDSQLVTTPAVAEQVLIQLCPAQEGRDMKRERMMARAKRSARDVEPGHEIRPWHAR